MYGSALHSSPPIRTRPPVASTRETTVAFAPTSAAVPVRSIAGTCRCARAIGRRTASDASAPAMNTINWIAAPAPRAATTAAATAATATGPRKNRPGVKISPIARPAATIAQMTQPGIPKVNRMSVWARQAERRREAKEIGQPVLDVRVAVGAVEEDPVQPERARPLDVFLQRVADHRSLCRTRAEQVKCGLKNRRMRLHAPVRAGVDDGVDVEPVVRDECVKVADAVRDEPELEVARAQVLQ